MAGLFSKAISLLQLGGEAEENNFVGSVVHLNGRSYRVLRILAEGGFSVVFVAQDTATGQRAALKRLIVPDQQRLDLVKNEIQVMSLCHACPHTVDFIDSETLTPRHTMHGNWEVRIVMELCPYSLVHILHQHGEGLPPHIVLWAMEATTQAVKFLHNQTPPIIHRDLKVENILISEDGHVKLCDFGSCTTEVLQPTTALQIGLAEEEIQLNTTPQYRAPEMWNVYSRIPIDYHCDLWALGCVLYKLCHYHSPFDEGTSMAVCNAVIQPPATGRNAIFNDIIVGLLQKEPEKRLTANQVLRELARVRSKLGPAPKGERENMLRAYEADSERNTRGGGGRAQMQTKFMGVCRNFRNTFNQGMGLAANAMQTNTHGQVQAKREETVSPKLIQFTPRLIGAVLDNQSAFSQLQRDADNQWKEKYFIFNLSGVPCSENMFGGRVKNVTWPNKGALSLAELWALCEDLHSWLLVEQDNRAVLLYMAGTERGPLAVSSFMVFCDLFPTPVDAFAYLCAVSNHVVKFRPSRIRLANQIRRIALRETVPTTQPITIQKIAWPEQTGAGMRGGLFFPVIFSSQGQVYNGQHGSAVESHGGVCEVTVNQNLTDDFIIVLAMAREDRLLQLCQLPLHSSFIDQRSVKFSVDDLDCPQKLLGPDFYLELQVAHGSPTNQSQPWSHGLGNGNTHWSVCFTSEAEAQQLIGQYRHSANQSLRTLDMPTSVPVPPRPIKTPKPYSGPSFSSSANEISPEQPAKQPLATTALAQDLPASASLIELGDSQSDQSTEYQIFVPHSDQSQGTDKSADNIDTQLAGMTNDLLGIDTAPSHTPLQMSGALNSHPHEPITVDHLVDMAEPVGESEMSAPDDLFGSWTTALEPMKKSQSEDSGTEKEGNINQLLDEWNMTEPIAATSQPLRGATRATQSPLSPSTALASGRGGPGLPQRHPNYRVSTAYLQKPMSSPQSPAKKMPGDPFENLSGLAGSRSYSNQPSNQEPQANMTGSSQSRRVGNNQWTGSFKETSSSTRPQQWQQPRPIGRHGPIFSPPVPLQTNSRRMQASPNILPKATNQRPANGSFDDLLTTHNFVPSKKDHVPVNMNAMRQQQQLADDVDGSAALKIKIEQWTEGKKGNIRALLSTLQDVLWANSGWAVISISQLLRATDVKKAYMKACLLVHPDKVEETENECLANMVFDEISKAYNAFKEQGMPSLG